MIGGGDRQGVLALQLVHKLLGCVDRHRQVVQHRFGESAGIAREHGENQQGQRRHGEYDIAHLGAGDLRVGLGALGGVVFAHHRTFRGIRRFRGARAAR